ncbi:xanthine dehydrogenase family protein molybdopterin-binding subunit [Nitriliruptor alkaliphilus]|uniref:xanthine dehydrogenase family protein molybdopterin-binding subunit n=1 Tax=Nitriliruptor alkaliphilus TaxID=427918 RepID=UPI000B0B7423|nr:molybdopterin cofactor-binding domain-containing protein [Nitriliruptor alkaliphilus]
MTLEVTPARSAQPTTVEPPSTARDVPASTGRSEGRLGEPVSRIDGAQKVMGLAQFAGEVPMEDLTYATLVYSSIARGRIATIDVTAARSAPGVVLVMTHENAPRLNRPAELLTAEKAAAPDSLPIMQDDQIHWNGQPVAIVLADTQEEADHAASLIDLTYEASSAVTSLAEAKPESRVADGDDGAPLRHEAGDAEAALRDAAFSVDNSYHTSPCNQNALELHAATLRWRDGELEIHDCTQTIAWVAWTVAEVFGLREDQVYVSAPFVGGAFGGKVLGQHLVIAAAASQMAGRPVRLVLSREGVYRVIGGRAETEQRVAIGADRDGRFSALIHRGAVAASRHNKFAEPFIIPTQSQYAAETMDLEVRKADLDIPSTGRMRAPGEATGSFALEAAVDELAVAMAIDPIELRLRNEPVRNPITDRDFSSRHLSEAFQIGAERFGWAQRDPEPGVRRDGEWLIGLGCAAAIYPYMRFPAASRGSFWRRTRVPRSSSPPRRWGWERPPPSHR